MLHVRSCAGGRPQGRSLPRPPEQLGAERPTPPRLAVANINILIGPDAVAQAGPVPGRPPHPPRRRRGLPRPPRAGGPAGAAGRPAGQTGRPGGGTWSAPRPLQLPDAVLAEERRQARRRQQAAGEMLDRGGERPTPRPPLPCGARSGQGHQPAPAARQSPGPGCSLLTDQVPRLPGPFLCFSRASAIRSKASGGASPAPTSRRRWGHAV